MKTITFSNFQTIKILYFSKMTFSSVLKLGMGLGRPNAWAVFKSDFWAWAGPGFSSFGLDQALGRPENHYWANLGHFGHPKTSVYSLAVAASGRLFGCRIRIFK